jgi:hypothetical protein
MEKACRHCNEIEVEKHSISNLLVKLHKTCITFTDTIKKSLLLETSRKVTYFAAEMLKIVYLTHAFIFCRIVSS